MKPRYPGWVQRLHLGEAQGITESLSAHQLMLCAAAVAGPTLRRSRLEVLEDLSFLAARRGSGYRRRSAAPGRGSGYRSWVRVGLAVRPGLHLFPHRPARTHLPETQIACGALCWLPRPATRLASVRRGWGKQAAGVSGPAGRALPWYRAVPLAPHAGRTEMLLVLETGFEHLWGGRAGPL